MTPKEKALHTHELLNQVYEELPAEPRRDNMRELISTMLSHRTSHDTEERAYFAMLEWFGDWKGVHHASEEELAEAIKGVMYPEQKARNIQLVLGRILEKSGDYSIDFLKDMPAEEGMEWLMSLPGVGLKTASLVLLFNFQKPVLPVDTHVHRIAQRVGMIPDKMSANKAHDLLLSHLPHNAKTLLNFHKHVYWHGQQVCTFRAPKHERCPLRSFCNYYQSLDEQTKRKTEQKALNNAVSVKKVKKIRGLH